MLEMDVSLDIYGFHTNFDNCHHQISHGHLSHMTKVFAKMRNKMDSEEKTWCVVDIYYFIK